MQQGASFIKLLILINANDYLPGALPGFLLEIFFPQAQTKPKKPTSIPLRIRTSTCFTGTVETQHEG
ncbi:MAG: hypothetical protein K2X66_11215 [Cyanobacteria bacterium]|nr:hypothetical protein [Cyanobacteriota bacterium]